MEVPYGGWTLKLLYRCSFCNTLRYENEVWTCAKCKMFAYCNQECQKHDWTAHKVICGDKLTKEISDFMFDGYKYIISAECQKKLDKTSSNIVELKCVDDANYNVSIVDKNYGDSKDYINNYTISTNIYKFRPWNRLITIKNRKYLKWHTPRYLLDINIYYLATSRYHTYFRFYTEEVADVDRYILSYLNDELLFNVYQVNRYLQSVCNDNFWLLKFKNEHKSILTKEELQGKSYYSWYRMYRRNLRLLDKLYVSIRYDHLSIFILIYPSLIYNSSIKDPIKYKSINIYKHSLQYEEFKNLTYSIFEGVCLNGIEWVQCLEFIEDFDWRVLFKSFDNKSRTLMPYLFKKLRDNECQESLEFLIDKYDQC